MSKENNLAGQKFGNWTAISKAGVTSNGKCIWACLCDCGNSKAIVGGDLRSGRSKSCGCLKKQLSRQRESLFLEGQRFGLLTVVKKSYKTTNHKTHWECLCECGTQVICTSGNLRSGNSYSCGCYHKQILSRPDDQFVNKRFGKLTVTAYAGRKYKHGNRYWVCKCDCGSEKHITTAHLVSGRIKSCGCIRSSAEEETSKVLTDIGLPFHREKRFPECRNIKTLPFDFFVHHQNADFAIECQGIQHYTDVPFFGGKKSLEKRNSNDLIKRKFCADYGIQLLEIRYDENPEDKIRSFIKILKPTPKDRG